jgi:putative acetyltransferase
MLISILDIFGVMSVPLELRRYDRGDLEEVHALVIRTIRGSYPAYYPPRAVEFFVEHHAREKITADGRSAFVIVAFSDGQMVGTATLALNEVARVFVATERQGLGIGAMLMARIESEARRLGLSRLELDASLPAFHFYEKRGYRKIADQVIDVGGDEELRYYRMEKDL